VHLFHSCVTCRDVLKSVILLIIVPVANSRGFVGNDGKKIFLYTLSVSTQPNSETIHSQVKMEKVFSNLEWKHCTSTEAKERRKIIVTFQTIFSPPPFLGILVSKVLLIKYSAYVSEPIFLTMDSSRRS
jgi:hypothetical protein